jgi:AcrR family transcriptional regulator
MPSHSVRANPRVPQQARGRERVAGLLEAAAGVIAEEGYDAATMSEIAQRAGASIGSLYQFFPNKEIITDVLREQYCEELRTLWSSAEEAGSLGVLDLVKRLVGEMIVFLDERPAFLVLLTHPCKTKNTSLIDLLRERLARILRTSAQHLSEARAFFLAVVVLQVMKGMNELYAELQGPKRKTLVREYERLLTGYLDAQLNPVGAAEIRVTGRKAKRN